MPSSRHEIPILLFREHPEAVPRLLHEALGVTIPEHARVEIASSDFTQLTPAEYRADLVVKLATDVPVMGMIVEVQLRTDPRKRFTWPLYAAALHARLECPVCLVVIAPDPSVAAWAAEPIATLQHGWPFAPLVIGPAQMPRITTADGAEAIPELAVLSAMAHVNGPGGLDIAAHALAAAGRLDPERATLYSDLVFFSASPESRKLLESKMNLSNYEYQSEFVKKFVEIGREEGREAGRAEHAVRAVLSVLAARGVTVPDDIRQRIEACRDVALLDLWHTRAVTAATAADVVAD